MCIAIIKPPKVSLPNFNILETCFSNNPHGAGFVCNHDNYNYLYKGYVNADSLYCDLLNKTQFNDTLLIHFRYATHGIVDKINCHPFYCGQGNDVVDGKSLCSALVHNGVLNIRTYGKYSDSFCFAKQLNDHKIDNDKIILSNNKIAIINSNGVVEKYGQWIEYKGCFYSNGTYRFKLTDFKSNGNIEYKLCDCCGTIGYYGFIDTKVGYHFCSQCCENRINWHRCLKCHSWTTDFYCNSCYLSDDSLNESYFVF